MDGNSPRKIDRKTPLITPKLRFDMLRRKSIVGGDVDIYVFEPCGKVDHVQDEAALEIS